MRPPIEAEKLGIPAVTIAARTFARQAKIIGKAEGIDDLPVVEYPGAFMIYEEAQIREQLNGGTLDDIINALTRKREAAKDSSATSSQKSAEEVVFRGGFDEINRYFSEREWTDHFPIVPPTRKRIEQFLRHSERSPHELVAVLPQANLKATPWNIAVNGIMAGCRPEDMPVLIAGVKAIEAPVYNLTQLGTTWALHPFFVLHGPIIKQMGIKYGLGLCSLGPNPALGRAFGLIIKNIGGFRPGETAMGTWGYSPPLFFAEDEGFLSTIGWKPYHEEEGFEAGTSAITAAGMWNWGDHLGMNIMRLKGAESLLQFIAFDVFRKVRPSSVLRGGFKGGSGMISILLSPPAAELFNSAGYTRKKIVEYVTANTMRTPLEWVDWWAKTGGNPLLAVERLKEHVQEGVLVRDMFDRPNEKTVPIIREPLKHIKVFVCGDAAIEKAAVLFAWYSRPSTHKVDLPGNWGLSSQ